MFKIKSLKNNKLLFLTAIIFSVVACTSTDNSPSTSATKASASATSDQPLFFFNEKRMNIAKQQLAAKNPVYVKAYKTLIKAAQKELKKKVDPVTNKTLIAASGDIHDYHSINPYTWPNPDTADGMPWVYRDGRYNKKVGSGSATDYNRRKKMLSSLETLNLAFYFSQDMVYLEKAKEIVKTWFVNQATKMNPNVNHGSSYPGTKPGSCFGILQWTTMDNVITSVQLIDKHKLWSNADSQTMQKWFTDYYTWLTTSELGIQESTRKNNHGTNYDYQALSLQLYLGKIKEAEAQIDITKKRINEQFAADGSQPHELKRTKSVNYTVNNLWAITRVADLSRRHTNNDLWLHKRADGVSLKTAFDFVVPYFSNPDAWKWKQITGNGAKNQLKNLALPMFSRTQLMSGEKILPAGLNGYHKFTAQDILTYAPLGLTAKK